MLLVADLETDPDQRYHPRALREKLPAETEYVVVADDPDSIEVQTYDGVVLSGSTAHVYEADGDWVARGEALVRLALEAEVPLLGVCFGHQLVNRALGGTVERDRYRAGFVECDHGGAGVLEGVAPPVPVSHSDLVTEVGDGLEVVGTTDYDDAFCTRHRSAPCWTVQFHPEFGSDLVERVEGWEPRGYSFEDSTAAGVLENFVDECYEGASRTTADSTATE